MSADEPESVAQLAEQLGIARVDLTELQVSAELIRLIPHELVRRYELLPLRYEDGGQRRLFVATADPLNTDGLDAIAHLLGVEVVPCFVPREELCAATASHYGREIAAAGAFLESASEHASLDVSAAFPEATSENDAEADLDAPIIQLVHRLIMRAVEQRASDIHLEPLARRFRVRYRIDGVLIEAEAPPKRLQAAIISRVKIMAGISIAEKRLPQDGRIQLKLPSARGDSRNSENQSSSAVGGARAAALDLRVSSLPTSHGESIVMRILDGESLRLGLGELGFMADDRAAFERLIAQPDGIVLVTGPTGSGKTTTLYSCLHAINQPDRKIITVEDPVEYQLSGVNQVPVRSELGMSFAAALRAMLRQAPNIVMLGEIRDAETAEIAIHASLTGHMVFSTLHTNDSPGAVTRLIEIGVKPFLVATSLRGVLAQRLVRKLCPDCAQAHTPSAAELSLLGIGEKEARGATFRRAAGCPKCHHTGYRGRTGIFELLLIDEAMQQLVHAGASASKLRAYARQNGMRSLREDGRRKVLAGLTTIEEVLAETLGDR
ncbi:type II secretion system protein E [Cephaloticoccus capnophilus]|uniref:Type II secretion system protein E n=1 Tax=Cephaloticoccus capnophilus TaxID=1548208 RepID=A0A139SSD8_9BACT|nr:ATPase, T2SS/T4P/T4SS family [Cephaloticoccus capnophilus]KXU37434.1 type II secretion system protein E [Cephaloticoccus capnophilus]